MKHVGGYVCVTDAMCCQSESQIKITSSRPGAAVDILTLTLSHVGLGEPWKVLMAALKVQEPYSSPITFKRVRKKNTETLTDCVMQQLDSSPSMND